MSFWLVAAPAGATPETLKQTPYLAMPSIEPYDWTLTPTLRHIKHQLKKMDDDAPPEAIALDADRIHGFVHKIQAEDMVCFVAVEHNKPRHVCFAQIVGKCSAHLIEDSGSCSGQGFEHRYQLKWFAEKGSMLKLRPYFNELVKAGDMPTEINNSKFSIALRNHLPLVGNRFVRWGWLILLLIIIKVFMLLYRQFQ